MKYQKVIYYTDNWHAYDLPLRAVKWQIVWLVCKNQDTVAVQNV
jgi:hypothetical protein